MNGECILICCILILSALITPHALNFGPNIIRWARRIVFAFGLVFQWRCRPYVIGSTHSMLLLQNPPQVHPLSPWPPKKNVLDILRNLDELTDFRFFHFCRVIHYTILTNKFQTSSRMKNLK